MQIIKSSNLNLQLNKWKFQTEFFLNKIIEKTLFEKIIDFFLPQRNNLIITRQR